MENTKKIVFRLNFSKKTGLGHLLRCLRLSNELIKKKYEIFFIIDSLEDIKLKKIKIFELYNKKKFTSEEKDANKCLEYIKKIKPIAVFIDDYRLSEKWHKIVRKFSKKIIVIDDLANRKIKCDIYINYKATNIELLKKKVQKICNRDAKLLLGPKYFIIDQKLKKIKNKKKFQILINFGNSFNFIKIKKFLINLCEDLKKLNHIKLLIVIGKLAVNYEYIFSLQNKYSNIFTIKKQIFIEKYINETNLFVGSAGNSIYEMSYLNIPSIFFSLNKNQENNIHDLEKLGHFFSLKFNHLNNIKLSFLISIMLKNYNRLKILNKTKKIFLKKKSINFLINNLDLK